MNMFQLHDLNIDNVSCIVVQPFNARKVALFMTTREAACYIISVGYVCLSVCLYACMYYVFILFIYFYFYFYFSRTTVSAVLQPCRTCHMLFVLLARCVVCVLGK